MWLANPLLRTVLLVAVTLLILSESGLARYTNNSDNWKNTRGSQMLGSPNTATLAIVANDTPFVSINDVSVIERTSSNICTIPSSCFPLPADAVFTVSLSAASSQTIDVTYNTADGTATAPSDYVVQSGTLTFSPGETAKLIFVRVRSDATPERNETFVVNLTSATGGAVIVKGQGLATIVNDDSIKGITPPVDFDGDGLADVVVYRNGEWFITQSSDGGMTAVGWGGLPQDIPVPADYDGDRKADIAVYRDGVWYIIHSSDGVATATAWGGLSFQDVPVPADYDGDGKADLAVYRRGLWFIIRSSDGGVTSVVWGGDVLDIPVPADYDGDGKADIAVYRHGLFFNTVAFWFINGSSAGATTAQWGGLPEDIPVPADYDGDGKSDIAVYRHRIGTWFIFRSSDGLQISTDWGGLPQDLPLNSQWCTDSSFNYTVVCR